jgi:hypothetical protein
MSSFISATEQSGILAMFSRSFDTWSRDITVYKEAIKVEVSQQPSTNSNSFGFGEVQQDPIYTYLPARTGVFKAIIRDSDIDSTAAQVARMSFIPEAMARIVASPISIKVKKDAYDFIEDGATTKIIDNFKNETYLLDGHGCLQTYQGSEYYVYPLRKSE